MSRTVPIRNTNIHKKPRVFDVTVNEEGNILEYRIQNIKGNISIEEAEVKKQIKEALAERAV